MRAAGRAARDERESNARKGWRCGGVAARERLCVPVCAHLTHLLGQRQLRHARRRHEHQQPPRDQPAVRRNRA